MNNDLPPSWKFEEVVAINRKFSLFGLKFRLEHEIKEDLSSSGSHIRTIGRSLGNDHHTHKLKISAIKEEGMGSQGWMGSQSSGLRAPHRSSTGEADRSSTGEADGSSTGEADRSSTQELHG